MSNVRSIVVLVTGVAGSGKTTVGRALAADLHWAFVEGDAFHPRSNVEKMARGLPLNDEDRAPWLVALRAEIDEHLQVGRSAVLACSALKASYRRTLRHPVESRVPLVFLDAPPSVLRARLESRRGHYFPAALLQSQLDALESPEGEPGVVVLDGTEPIQHLVHAARTALRL